ncbi:hypothetical protein GA0115239_108622 [Streptomyces sp. BpilaLS-43]|nr:hypothetical protein GA0115239_108622 [Streptomyces sp. BpilaLS-43]
MRPSRTYDHTAVTATAVPSVAPAHQRDRSSHRTVAPMPVSAAR